MISGADANLATHTDLVSGVSRSQGMRPEDNRVFISAGTPFQ
jgi:hypothetical protein